MSWSTLNIEAFLAVARHKRFSEAARFLHLTQSAVSQRVAKFEDELGISLFIRDPKNLRLTEAGKHMLRYALANEKLFEECNRTLKPGNSPMQSGEIRVGGFSTIVRSLVLECVGPLVRQNPGLHLALYTRNTRSLPDLLAHGVVDFIVYSEVLHKAGVISEYLGSEKYVLIDAKATKTPPNVFLDHDENDQTTIQFLRHNKLSTQKIKRQFLGDIYGIVDGVSLGLGKSVVPKHLTKGQKRIKVIPRLKNLEIPLYLCYYQQPFYTKLHDTIILALKDGFKLGL